MSRPKPVLSPAMERLLDYLVLVAARGAACPPTNQLARVIGCSQGTVAPTVAGLVEAGLIACTVETVRLRAGGVSHHRVVTILATGRRTAARDAVVSEPAAVELERAKTYLRQRGPIVHDAWVTHGRDAVGLVVVDHQLLTPAEVIARARALGLAGVRAPVGEGA